VQLDTHPEHVAANPENAIIVKPWKGAPGDKGLIELIPFLECEFHFWSLHCLDWAQWLTAIGIYKPSDVRAILKAYEGKDIPLEYAKKEAANKQAFIEEWKARGGGKVHLSTPIVVSATDCLAGFEQRRLHRKLPLLQRCRQGQL
jgi:mitochondrial import inner membrane translocase subunit TIM50